MSEQDSSHSESSPECADSDQIRDSSAQIRLFSGTSMPRQLPTLSAIQADLLGRFLIVKTPLFWR